MTAMASGVTSDEAGMVGIAARAWDATENWVAKAPRDAEIEFVHASAFARPGGSRRIVVIGETIPSGGVRGVGAFGLKDAENGDAKVKPNANEMVGATFRLHSKVKLAYAISPKIRGNFQRQTYAQATVCPNASTPRKLPVW